MSAPDGGLLAAIVTCRRARIAREGHTLGADVPALREAPPVPFGRRPFLICEIKRRSPSRGEIDPALDAPRLAGLYARRGAGAVSVLTEEDHFGGSLADLVAVKRRHPRLAVLRKDFLLDEEDLEVSWRAGADAVLLLAAALETGTLRRLCRRAAELGLAALVEVHGEADVEKARAARPAFTGINSRDLATFRVDHLAPLGLKRAVDWDTSLVFESGVRGGEDARLAIEAGFDGVLVGEAVVRRPALIGELLAAFPAQAAGLPPGRSFWSRLAARRPQPGRERPEAGVCVPTEGREKATCRESHGWRERPWVKICGITRVEDARLAAGLGADLLGFVFAPSPRRADPRILRELDGLEALKVGVVVTPRAAGRPVPDAEVRELLAEGLLDAVQLHGDERPEECLGLGYPYYKALPVGSLEDVDACGRYLCPRVLADAWSGQARGGTGRPIREDLVDALRARGPLWMAGGIGPDNVGRLARRFRPELIDASSRLEAAPGVKDPRRLARFFREIDRAWQDGAREGERE